VTTNRRTCRLQEALTPATRCQSCRPGVDRAGKTPASCPVVWLRRLGRKRGRRLDKFKQDNIPGTDLVTRSQCRISNLPISFLNKIRKINMNTGSLGRDPISYDVPEYKIRRSKLLSTRRRNPRARRARQTRSDRSF
jgi:hypothetical protein